MHRPKKFPDRTAFTLAERLCIILHRIGSMRRDLWETAAFGQFLALAFYGGSFVGWVVEMLTFAIVRVALQESTMTPSLDRVR